MKAFTTRRHNYFAMLISLSRLPGCCSDNNASRLQSLGFILPTVSKVGDPDRQTS